MRSKTSRLQQEHDIQRELEHCIMLQENGGCPGNMEHRSTGQLLPLLIGLFSGQFDICSWAKIFTIEYIFV